MPGPRCGEDLRHDMAQEKMEGRVLERQEQVEGRELERQEKMEARVLERQEKMEGRELERQEKMEGRELERVLEGMLGQMEDEIRELPDLSDDMDQDGVKNGIKREVIEDHYEPSEIDIVQGKVDGLCEYEIIRRNNIEEREAMLKLFGVMEAKMEAHGVLKIKANKAKRTFVKTPEVPVRRSPRSIGNLKTQVKKEEGINFIFPKHIQSFEEPKYEFESFDHIPKEHCTGDLQELDARVKGLMNFGTRSMGGTMGKSRVCKLCGKEGIRQVIMDHIEENHIDGIAVPCNSCDKTFMTRTRFRLHQTSHKIGFKRFRG